LSIHIGPYAFDYVRYDAEADVLYLSMDEPREGYGEETPEGHFLRFDEDGTFRGVTILDAQHMLDEHGGLTVTLPVPESVELPGGNLQLA
jgi:uncharacterized protein YuzE